MFETYCRVCQAGLRVASYALDWRRPSVIHGPHSLERLPPLIALRGIGRVLVVTDADLVKLGLIDALLAGLNREGIAYTLYDETVPNPTIDNIEAARSLYLETGCEAIVAFGGGSPMDCAKAVGARVARPDRAIGQMKGLLRVRRRPPALFAVPTTAGTGSEATIAAVVADPPSRDKYAINDLVLIPTYAVLDPVLTVGLPPFVTATTGMDALTHALEAYIGLANTRATREYSRRAVSLVFESLETAYRCGGDLTARDNMLMASHCAGIAFTRAYVGYTHALAHALGGFYGTPHGLANAVLLPYVLEAYGACVHDSLAELAQLAGLCEPGDSAARGAVRFTAAIRDMNRRMDIPDHLEDIRGADIPLMADRAFREANPLYPVPRILSRGDLIDLIHTARG